VTIQLGLIFVVGGRKGRLMPWRDKALMLLARGGPGSGGGEDMEEHKNASRQSYDKPPFN